MPRAKSWRGRDVGARARRITLLLIKTVRFPRDSNAFLTTAFGSSIDIGIDPKKPARSKNCVRVVPGHRTKMSIGSFLISSAIASPQWRSKALVAAYVDR